MRLAYFSPLNPQRSGISDYSEELLPALAENADIDLFVDGIAPTNPALASSFNSFDYRAEPACLQLLKEYDALLCHMGNSFRYHSGIYDVALKNRAIVVFHDFGLQHFFLERARELHEPRIYLDELEASAGLQGRLEAEEALSRGAAPSQYLNPAAFPMNSRLANRAEGIIVHSEWSRSRLARIAPGVALARINMHVAAPSNFSRTSPVGAGKELSIASFGFITANKGLEAALRALAALKQDHSFHYHLVGESDNYFDIQELARLYRIADRISITGYVTLDEFKDRVRQTDIAINLREQTVGETSASLCRLMQAGVPTLVSSLGWFSELPDDSVIKIDPDRDVDLQVCAYLKALMENAELRQRIGINARRYVMNHHRVEQTAAAYLDFVRQVIAGRARRRFLDGITGELAWLSKNEPDELLLEAVAGEIAAL